MRLLALIILMAFGVWHFASTAAMPVVAGGCHAAATAAAAEIPSHPVQQQAHSADAKSLCADLAQHACCTAPAVMLSSLELPMQFDNQPPSQIVERLEPQPPLPPFRPPTARLS
jgi:hypothetical protein